jgi:ABC-type multidrug transport system ATPase subunit
VQQAIRTHGLTRRFAEAVVVDRLNLAVPAGLVTGFLGPNGSGKTTTIRMLLGLIRPSAGRIEILGRAMPADRIAIARRIGAMVESPCHYDHLTGRENLEVTRRLMGIERGEIDRALEAVDLAYAAGQRVGGYSLGMRQRLGIARALLGRPELLILDEPANALDPDGIIDMRKLLRTLARDQGLTIFVSSHLLSEVQQTADHVALIARGRMIAQGPMEEILGTRRSTILVRPSDHTAAAAMLRAHGLEVAETDGGRLRIARSNDVDAAAVARLIQTAGFALHELGEEQPTLERVYLDLTAKQEAA